VAVGQRVVGVVISVGGLRELSEGGVLVVILPVRDSCTLEATRSASATDCLTVSKTRSAASLLGLLLQKRSRAKLYLCVTKRLYFIFKVYSSSDLWSKRKATTPYRPRRPAHKLRRTHHGAPDLFHHDSPRVCRYLGCRPCCLPPRVLGPRRRAQRARRSVAAGGGVQGGANGGEGLSEDPAAAGGMRRKTSGWRGIEGGVGT
jgi:hypothetical protein